MTIDLLADHKNMYLFNNFTRTLLMLALLSTDSTKIDQIFGDKVKFHVLIYFNCKVYILYLYYGNNLFKNISSYCVNYLK